MISIIISFRFSSNTVNDPSQKSTVDRIFRYWELMHELFDIELVFVNDHSENFWIQGSYIYPMPGIKKDWNMPVARNYGAEIARGTGLLFTDIDHILVGNFNLLETPLKTNHYLKFPRMEKTYGSYIGIDSHKNTFFIKKEDFPGYDPDFSGHYGHDDTELMHRLNKTHRPILSKDTLTAYTIPLDSSGLARDSTFNKILLAQKTGGIQQQGQHSTWKQWFKF